MAAETTSLLQVQLPEPRLRDVTERIFQLRNQRALARVRIICISDTHNRRPRLPPGDLLIHAGNLSEWGTFEEIQAQLFWLSSQPHEHKVVIAGSHDFLFDDDYLAQQPESQDPYGRTKHDLNFGSVIYLQDASVTLSFAEGERMLRIYGSPWTPQNGLAAFQYPRGEDWWTGHVPDATDVLVTHGPPSRIRKVGRWAGCGYLRREVARVKPRLMVFGHFRRARGEQVMRFDAAQQVYDGVIERSWGWWALPLLALAVAWSRLRQLVGFPAQSTTMINAVMVSGKKKKGVPAEPYVVDL